MEDNIKKFDETGMVTKEYVFAKYPECFAKWDSTLWCWLAVSIYAKLSESFISEFSKEIDWECISKFQNLSEDFVTRYADKVDWFCISAYQHLSEDFIEKHADEVNWQYVSKKQHLGEKFMEKFADRIWWNEVSKYQHLGEGFIRKFADRVNWKYISVYQCLSEDFIKEYVDKGYIDRVWLRYLISEHQVLTPEFAAQMDISIKNNCLRTPDEWKSLVKFTGLYECHDDYFVAYKGVRLDRYSDYNFQFQYMPGEVYECFSDYSDEENSFGLSAWTEEKASEYCNKLIIKVKINYEDVTAVVQNGGKIRCKKLTVLN